MSDAAAALVKQGEGGEVSPAAGEDTNIMEMRRYFLESKQVFTWDQTTVDTVTTRYFTADDGSRKREESHVIEKKTLFTRDYSFRFGGIELIAHFEKDKLKYVDIVEQDRQEGDQVVVDSITPTLQLDGAEDDHAALQEKEIIKPAERERSPPRKPSLSEVDQIDNTIIVETNHVTEIEFTKPAGVALTDKVLQKPLTPVSNGEISPGEPQQHTQDDKMPDMNGKPDVNGKLSLTSPEVSSASTEQSELYITPEGTPNEILSPDEEAGEQNGQLLEEKRLIKPPSQSPDHEPPVSKTETMEDDLNTPVSQKTNGDLKQELVIQSNWEETTTTESVKTQEMKDEQVSPAEPEPTVSSSDEPQDIQTAVMPTETLQKPEETVPSSEEDGFEPKDKSYLLKNMVESAFEVVETDETRIPPKNEEIHGQEPREEFFTPDQSVESFDLDSQETQSAPLPVETLEQPMKEKATRSPEGQEPKEEQASPAEPEPLIASDEFQDTLTAVMPSETIQRPEEETYRENKGTEPDDRRDMPKDSDKSPVDVRESDSPKTTPKIEDVQEQELREEFITPDQSIESMDLDSQELPIQSATLPEETMKKPATEKQGTPTDKQEPEPKDKKYILKDLVESAFDKVETEETQSPHKVAAPPEQEPLEERVSADIPEETLILNDADVAQSATVPEKVVQGPQVEKLEESPPTPSAPVEEELERPLDEKPVEGVSTSLSSQEPFEDVVFAPDTGVVFQYETEDLPANTVEPVQTATLSEEFLEPPPLPEKTRKSQDLDEQVITVMAEERVLDIDTNQNETMAVTDQVIQAPAPPSQEPEVEEIQRPEADATVDAEEGQAPVTTMGVTEEIMEVPRDTEVTQKKETIVTTTEIVTEIDQDTSMSPTELRQMVESAFDILDEPEAQENVTDVPVEVDEHPVKEIQTPLPPSQEPEVDEIQKPEVDATVVADESPEQVTTMDVPEETIEGPPVSEVTKKKKVPTATLR